MLRPPALLLAFPALTDLGLPSDGRLDDTECGTALEGSTNLEDEDCVLTRMTIFEVQTP